MPTESYASARLLRQAFATEEQKVATPWAASSTRPLEDGSAEVRILLVDGTAKVYTRTPPGADFVLQV